MTIPAPLPSPADLADDLAPLSDAFTDAASLSAWRRYEEEEGWPDQLADRRVDEGAGRLEWTVRPSVWYAPLRGPFLHKEVEGDFALFTRASVLDADGAFPRRLGCLAGLMLRVPRDAPSAAWRREDDDYVVHATGVASGASGLEPAIEITTTTRGFSGLESYRSRPGPVELGLARLGPTVLALHRFEGEAWTLTQRRPGDRWGSFDYQGEGLMVRADLPRRLQVGLMAMADWGPIIGHQGLGFGNEYFARPDTFNRRAFDPVDGGLRARFDFARFRRLRLPDAWARRNLSVDVPEEELVAFVTAGGEA